MNLNRVIVLASLLAAQSLVACGGTTGAEEHATGEAALDAKATVLNLDNSGEVLRVERGSKVRVRVWVDDNCGCRWTLDTGGLSKATETQEHHSSVYGSATTVTFELDTKDAKLGTYLLEADLAGADFMNHGVWAIDVVDGAAAPAEPVVAPAESLVLERENSGKVLVMEQGTKLLVELVVDDNCGCRWSLASEGLPTPVESQTHAFSVYGSTTTTIYQFDTTAVAAGTYLLSARLDNGGLSRHAWALKVRD